MDTSKQGIKEYKKFFKRRITEGRLNCMSICAHPCLVNTVWLAHLAFNGQHLQDVAALTVEIGKVLPTSVNTQTTP
jgi:hypothetical protein